MNRRWLSFAALVTLTALPAGGAFGAPVAPYSPLSLQTTDPGAPEAPLATLAANGEATAYAAGFAKAPPPYEYSRYRPRRRPVRDRYRDEDYSRRRSEALSQLHAGFFDPEGDQNAGILFGFRGALVVDQHIQVGGQLDWIHKATSEGTAGPPIIGPGGTPITPEEEIARSSLNMFPLMAFVQITADPDLPVVPYFGAGAGYQLLFLSAENFDTGEEFDGTFDGFGWQVWGGAGIPLSRRARLNTEVFVNNAELSGDVENSLTGEEFRGVVDMDGIGMRFGLAWGF
jgi:hypothetical protein